MEATPRNLDLWEGPAALILDGGSGKAERPPLHLQAAAGGYVRLVAPTGPVLWGRVDDGWYGIDIVRARGSSLPVLPPIRSNEAAHARGTASSPEFLSWWIRHYAEQLRASSITPLARGRHCLMSAERLSFRRGLLDDLLAQRDELFFSWDNGYAPLLLTRPLSDETDGRVKMWRKRARDKTLPPLLTWWCRGVFAHVLLDGHDRVHAALLEGITPDVIVLADAAPKAKADVEERKQLALEHAALLETTDMPSRALSMNTILRAGWNPRADWELATPGFPLDGGVEQWMDEVRGTSLVEP
jgi:hypothetical protein